MSNTPLYDRKSDTNRVYNRQPVELDILLARMEWLFKDIPFEAMDTTPEFMRASMLDELREGIRRVLDQLWDISSDDIVDLKQLVDLRDGKISIHDLGESPYDLTCIVNDAWDQARRRQNEFILRELCEHGEGMDPETANNRHLQARYKKVNSLSVGTDWKVREYVTDRQKALRWLHGEIVNNPKTYLTYVPDVISENVKLALQMARHDAICGFISQANASSAVEAIQDAIDGNEYDRKALPSFVADIDVFRSEFMPKLEQNLMQELEEKGFIEPEQSQTKVSDSNPNKYTLER